METRFIQDLLQRLDVVDVVGRYVPLKRSGSNFMTCCPFHHEKSPSFSVSPSKQFYHCFGCGKNGDAIRFVMEYAGLGFVEAVRELAGSVGMALPDSRPVSPAEAAAQQARTDHRTRLGDVMTTASNWWHAQLQDSAKAQAYVHKRGLSADMVDRYHIGYAPAQRQGLAQTFHAPGSGRTQGKAAAPASIDYGSALLLEAGLVIDYDATPADSGHEGKRRYDRFRDRLMFPIRNSRGQIIAAGGRILDQGEPKYLNSPETPLFSKGQELYGLFEARQALGKLGYALVTEGYMDVLALAQAGFDNTVATLGTACSSAHVQKLFRHVDKIVFAFDGDAAGRRAAHKALEVALPFVGDRRSAHFLFLPAEHDPDSFIRQYGHDAFAQSVASATPLSLLLQELGRHGCDLQHAEGRARYCQRAMTLWQQLPDSLLKRQVLAEIAKTAQLPEHDLLQLPLARAQGGGATPAHGAHVVPGYGGTARYAQTAPTASSARAGYADPQRKGSAFGSSPSSRNSSNQFTWRPPGLPLIGRVQPRAREDRALGILFAHAALWQELSSQDHHTLSHWHAPYGALFAWLEQHMMEHGAQAFALLSLQLRAQPSLAEHLPWIQQQVAHCSADPDLERSELRNILDRMQAYSDAAEMRRIVQDPTQLERYRYLLEKQSERAQQLRNKTAPPHAR